MRRRRVAPLEAGSLPLSLGLRAAKGGTGDPVVATLVAVTGSMLLLAMGVVLTASVDKLAGTPRLYGGDAQIVSALGGASPSLVRSASRAARRDPDVRAATAVALDQVAIDAHDVGVLGARALRNDGVRIATTAGTMPRARGIAFAPPTLRQLHLHLGELVTVRRAGRTAVLRITGTAILPTVGWESGEVGLGGGGVVSLRTLQSLDPQATVTRILARLRPGIATGVALRRLETESGALWSPQPLPAGIDKVARVHLVPLIIALMLALAALVLVGHYLAVSTHRRRDEFAILRTLGLSPRSASLVVVVQGSTWILLGASLGIPVGIVVGSRLWDDLASRLGVIAAPVAPASLGLCVPGILVVCIAISIAPALAVARMSLAETLRAD
jgi:putative ABC transport system permease protein